MLKISIGVLNDSTEYRLQKAVINAQLTSGTEFFNLKTAASAEAGSVILQGGSRFFISGHRAFTFGYAFVAFEQDSRCIFLEF
ncbi:hypothetical protein QG37_06186 [Candidozyma auris]|uniref:Uncharacterized protein n=1 Tax=Candidozyma auris TaxID=498019 RepID=A0A0L0NVN7_CANAR|nr:hypothetical protein QG37_06186 [[Candida] auris]